MIFSICGSAGADLQSRLTPSSTTQLPILAALNVEAPTLLITLYTIMKKNTIVSFPFCAQFQASLLDFRAVGFYN